MVRRKGEQPIVRHLQRYSPSHPVAQMIASGDRWFDAWLAQASTSLVRIQQATGIPVSRLLAMKAGDYLTRAEADALARLWSVSTEDLILSIGDAMLIVD